MSESLSPPSVAAEAAVVVTPASPSFWLARRVSALTPMRRDALCEAEAPPATRGVPCSVRATALGRPRGCTAAATPGLADGSLPTAPPAGQLRVASLHHVRRPLLLPGQPGAAAPPGPRVLVRWSVRPLLASVRGVVPRRREAEPSAERLVSQSGAARRAAPSAHAAGALSVPGPRSVALGTSPFRPPRSRR